MISTKDLANYIESRLNDYGDKKFKIYADIGDFKKAYRPLRSNDIEYYTNGILEALTPDIVPIKNVKIAIQNVQVSFVFDIELLDKDNDGNYNEVVDTKKVINEWAMSINGTPSLIYDDEGNSFEITPQYNGITIGVVSQLSPIGEALPVFLNLSFVIVSGGVNSNSVEFRLNGETLLTQDVTIQRTRQSETNMFAQDSASKTIIQSNGLSFKISIPFIDTDENKKIEKDILEGSMNKAQLFEYTRGMVYKAYIMVLGNDGMSLAPSKNIGIDFDLVEGKQDLLSYGEGWNVVVEETQDKDITIQLGLDTPKTIVAFWGDGTSTTTINETEYITHTYLEDGEYTIRYFIY